MDKNITVSGCCGYLGSLLSKLLIDDGYKVTGLDICYFGKDSISDIIDHPNFRFIEGDIINIRDLTKSIKGSYGFINFSGIVGDAASAIEKDENWMINIEASRAIVDVCNYYKINRFLFASSCSVYGQSRTKDHFLTEGSWKNPVSDYAVSKIDSENTFLSGLDKSITATILRLSTVMGYSPRQRWDLIVNLMTILAHQKGKVIVEGGNQFRPFIAAMDVARAFKFVLEVEDVSLIDREIFNIHKTNISILDLAYKIKEYFPDLEIEIRKDIQDVRDYKVSSDKIKYLLGFEPEITLEKCIEELIQKIKENGYADFETNSEQYNNYKNFLQVCNKNRKDPSCQLEK